MQTVIAPDLGEAVRWWIDATGLRLSSLVRTADIAVAELAATPRARPVLKVVSGPGAGECRESAVSFSGRAGRAVTDPWGNTVYCARPRHGRVQPLDVLDRRRAMSAASSSSSERELVLGS